MHDAFTPCQLLKSFPYVIESIACFNNILLVGTKQGLLLVYEVRNKTAIIDKAKKSSLLDGLNEGSQRSPSPSDLPDSPPQYDINLQHTLKEFSKKPIIQMAVVPEYELLITLSDSIINVYTLRNFTFLHSVTKTRGANVFAIDLYAHSDARRDSSVREMSSSVSGTTHRHQGSVSSVNSNSNYLAPLPDLRLCVGVKKKLQIYHWLGKEFVELRPEFNLPEIPKIVEFCQDQICVGFRTEYTLIDLNSGDVKTLFPPGRSQNPIAYRYSDEQLALVRDEDTALINCEGKPVKKFKWTAPPIALQSYPPYVVAVIENYVEVRTIEPKLLIQTLSLPKPYLICQRMGMLFIASKSALWLLSSMSRVKQIRELVKNKDFELALRLGETASAIGQPDINTRDLRNLYAFHLHCQRQFRKALEMFEELRTDPSHVLGLFPTLLPDDYRASINYPDHVPELSNDEMSDARDPLITYLVSWRRRLKRYEQQATDSTNKSVDTYAIVEGTKTIQNRDVLQQIVDTSLLKCYLHTNNFALVASLLRSENHCHMEEAKKMLKFYKRPQDLVLLYQSRGRHREALSLLHKESSRENSPLRGYRRSIKYLQNLGPAHIDVVFEFATWIVKANPAAGLKIFTRWDVGDSSNHLDSHFHLGSTSTAYKDKIVEFLEKTCPRLVIPYLEHMIFEPLRYADGEIIYDDDLEEDEIEDSSAGEELSDIAGSGVSRDRSWAVLKMNEGDDKNRSDTGISLGLSPINLKIAKQPSGINAEELHTRYVSALRSRIDTMVQSGAQLAVKAADEPGEVGIWRSKLIAFLELPDAMYIPDRLISQFPYDGFFEERALLLAKMNKHEQALAIWIHILNDWSTAESHCARVYPFTPNNQCPPNCPYVGNTSKLAKSGMKKSTRSLSVAALEEIHPHHCKDVYFLLLKLCLEPPDPAALGIRLPPGKKIVTDHNVESDSKFNRALEILRRFGDKMDPVKTLHVLPQTAEMNIVLPFLKTTVEMHERNKLHNIFLKNLYYAEKLMSGRDLIQVTSQKFVLDTKTQCRVCLKRIGRSAFARQPNGDILHYGCVEGINLKK